MNTVVGLYSRRHRNIIDQYEHTEELQHYRPVKRYQMFIVDLITLEEGLTSSSHGNTYSTLKAQQQTFSSGRRVSIRFFHSIHRTSGSARRLLALQTPKKALGVIVDITLEGGLTSSSHGNIFIILVGLYSRR